MPHIVHDKSSSLGEPLTEPGEYENLPFHGLQTAPNKVQKNIFIIFLRLHVYFYDHMTYFNNPMHFNYIDQNYRVHKTFII